MASSSDPVVYLATLSVAPLLADVGCCPVLLVLRRRESWSADSGQLRRDLLQLLPFLLLEFSTVVLPSLTSSTFLRSTLSEWWSCSAALPHLGQWGREDVARRSVLEEAVAASCTSSWVLEVIARDPPAATDSRMELRRVEPVVERHCEPKSELGGLQEELKYSLMISMSPGGFRDQLTSYSVELRANGARVE